MRARKTASSMKSAFEPLTRNVEWMMTTVSVGTGVVRVRLLFCRLAHAPQASSSLSATS